MKKNRIKVINERLQCLEKELSYERLESFIDNKRETANFIEQQEEIVFHEIIECLCIIETEV